MSSSASFSQQETRWKPDFFYPSAPPNTVPERFLIILNQPFSHHLLHQLWTSTTWRACADGGSNRLFDLVTSEVPSSMDLEDKRTLYIPDLIKGDLDSAREDVLDYYRTLNVPIVQDNDQDSTDLMKCVQELDGKDPSREIIILGGLSGRLDQTIHTLSYLHKLRKSNRKVYAVTEENIAWVLDAGEHKIHIDHSLFGPTCGLLPVGIESSIISTTGLRWNLDNAETSFDGMVSTSNHLLVGANEVCIKTSKPIWWTMELRNPSAGHKVNHRV